MEKLLKKHAEKLRFAVVGGANTAIDFAVLFALTFAGVDKIVANYASTSVALIFSFFANKSFTFKDKSGNAKKQFVAFLIITLAGLWVLQPIIIWISTSALAPHISSEAVNLFIAKLIATVASLVWNYLLYSRLVFKKNEK
ncbi:MAG: GtrA family protein [Candidatus Microsaccharimonas sp.]